LNPKTGTLKISKRVLIGGFSFSLSALGLTLVFLKKDGCHILMLHIKEFVSVFYAHFWVCNRYWVSIMAQNVHNRTQSLYWQHQNVSDHLQMHLGQGKWAAREKKKQAMLLYSLL
jgi:hypothetical protein